jgi:hypothetical protein
MNLIGAVMMFRPKTAITLGQMFGCRRFRIYNYTVIPMITADNQKFSYRCPIMDFQQRKINHASADIVNGFVDKSLVDGIAMTVERWILSLYEIKRS